MLQRSGKGFPEMPFALNVIYSTALVIFSPLLLYRWIRAGKYREGWGEKFQARPRCASAGNPVSGFMP